LPSYVPKQGDGNITETYLPFPGEDAIGGEQVLQSFFGYFVLVLGYLFEHNVSGRSMRGLKILEGNHPKTDKSSDIKRTAVTAGFEQRTQYSFRNKDFLRIRDLTHRPFHFPQST
jgi:hypothetical protein